MPENYILSELSGRRSIRKFLDRDIPEDYITAIIEAGRWAPSGLNNQPWKFVVIKDQSIKEKLSELTHYGEIIRGCNTCIPVYFNLEKGYNRDKDLMSIGACIQNMLLAVHSIGLGGVWLGEILNKKSEVNILLDISNNYELMAVLALGFPGESPKSNRVPLDSLVLKRY